MQEKSNIRTEALYSDDKTHRYILKKSWDNNKPSAAIIMISPSSKSNEVCMDLTTLYTVNNCYEQGFGSAEILNLYSNLDTTPSESSPENDDWIAKSCQKADKVILAWGKGQNAKDVLVRISEVLRLIEPFKAKLFEIADSTGKAGHHPLSATVRLHWVLTPFNYPTIEQKS